VDCRGENFSISFTEDAYKCHDCGFQDHKQRIKERDAGMLKAERPELGQGKLCQLVSRVKGISMDEAISLFRNKALRAEMENVA
jgi:hypothetical protein